jgi:methylated-DNA-[protein]-cysteine S-methyltransferase
VQQLQEYFNSQRTDFTFKLNPKGTDFQQKFGTHYSIPFGKTRTYLEQSKFLGDPKAIRAVASANGKPTLIVVPVTESLVVMVHGCRRFMAQKWLLEHENPSRNIVCFSYL